MKVSKEVNEAANAIAEVLDSAVYVYSGPIDTKGYGGIIKTIEPSEAQPFRPNSVLLLTTYGGSPGPAYRIARLFQNISKDFYLCVPFQCKSAGTLIALGATKIFIPVVGELGPLDIQLSRKDEIGQQRSGMVVRTALGGLAEETLKAFEQIMLKITISSEQTISFDVASRVAAQIATGIMTPVYAQIDPELLGNDLRDLNIVTAYGERLLRHGGNATPETVRRLVEEYPTHDFIIDSKEARDLFNSVEDPTDEMTTLTSALGKLAYEVQTPHFIQRVDGHFEPEGEEVDASGGGEGDPATVTGMDGGRQKARRSNRGSGRKAKESDAEGDNGDEKN